MSNLRWKVITIVAVFIIFFAVGVYPLVAQRYGIHSPSWLLDKALKLGLDLKGGVHLVLRVQTEDALRLVTDQEMERLREALKSKSVPFTRIEATDAVHFKVEGIAPAQDAAFRQVASEVQTNFDRSAGTNGTYTFTMRPNIQVNLRDEADPKMVLTAVRPLSPPDLSAGSAVVIDLGLARGAFSLEEIRSLLVRHPGETPVYFSVPGEGTSDATRIRARRILVRPSDEMLRELRERLGVEAVHLS